MRIHPSLQNGWLVAATMGAFMFFTGSDSQSEKVASIDTAKTVQQSQFGQAKHDEFNQRYQSSVELLNFVKTNRVISEQQVHKLKELSLNLNPQEADKNALNALKKEIENAGREYNELSQKKELNQDQKAKLSAYSKLVNNSQMLLQNLQARIQEHLDESKNRIQTEIDEKARQAFKEAAQSKGFTQVYDSSVLVYCSNDLTNEAITKLDAKK